ncbi:hypothetical protein QOT17_025190 [Balamuthia mandrillaris]
MHSRRFSFLFILCWLHVPCWEEFKDGSYALILCGVTYDGKKMGTNLWIKGESQWQCSGPPCLCS